MKEETKAIENKTELTKEEVYDVLKFARSASTSPLYNNYFSPDLVNSAMKDINTNPLVADQDKIDAALKSPKTSEEELIGYNQYFALIDMIYKRSLGYMGNMLTYDLEYIPTNVTKDKLKKPEYQKDVDVLNDFLNKFDHKKEFAFATRQMLSQEAFFSVLRDDGDIYTLQELPRKYCKLTGRWDYGFLFDFDLYWFTQPSVDINMYPNSFKTMYTDWMGNGNKYNPSNPVGKRNSSFTYWVQTDPEENFWAWKFNPDITTLIPYFAPLLPDAALRPLIRNLQKNVYILQAQRLIIGLIPMLKENKSGNVKDMLAVSPEVMGKFLGLLKQGLDDAIKVGGAPFEDVKSIDFDSTDKDILNTYSKTYASTSVSGGRLIYSGDKQTSKETEMSVMIDEYIVKYLYPYFEKFLEYHINKRTKKYKFKIKLDGTQFDRDKRLDRAMSLADKGIVLPQKIAGAMGMSLYDLEMELEMANATGFVDKLIPMMNIYTQSGDTATNPKGRPEKGTDDLSDSGMTSKETR